MRTSHLLLLLSVVFALCASATAQNVQVHHYPLTVDDIAPYMPAEYLAQIRQMTPEQQRVWAWKQTDDMIAKGLIKRQPGWEPWSESIAKVANDAVPGAGDVVRKTAADIQQVGKNAQQLVNDPSIHNLAKTVASAAAVPIDAENGAKQVLKDNADRVLDRNNLSALKPVANFAIDTAVSKALPISGAVGIASKVATAVENHTDDQDHVLVCSVAAHNAAVAASNGAAPAKSLMEISISSMLDHAVDAEAEALWKAGIIPQNSCHYVPGKALKQRGFVLPKKPKLGKQKDTSKAKPLSPGAVSLPANHPAAKAAMQTPQVKAALAAHASKAFKPKFLHPALRGLGAVAAPATKKAASKPKANAAANKNKAKNNTPKPNSL